MKKEAPNRNDAENALAEAAGLTASVRRADRPLASALLVLGVMYVGVGVIVWAIGSGAASGLALAVVLAVGLAGVVLVLLRMRASSRVGKRLYQAGIAFFLIWNGVVIVGSSSTGWWAPHAPGWHFTVSAAVAALPLFVAAALLLRRSR